MNRIVKAKAAPSPGRHRLIIFALLISFCGTAPAAPSKSARFNPVSEATVIAVYDGDTIKVRFPDGLEKKVRFIGVDSPEMDDSREPVEFMAQMAKRFTYLSLYSQKIELTGDWQAEDDYGRLLAYVWIKKLGLFNEHLIHEGYAFAFLKYRFRQDYRDRFKRAEAEARRSGKGLWRKENSPLVPAEEASRHLGELVSVSFVCSKVAGRGSFVSLDSSGPFHAVIPRANRGRFPGLEDMEGALLVVMGIVEDYKGSAEIRIFVPYQITTAGRPERRL